MFSLRKKKDMLTSFTFKTTKFIEFKVCHDIFKPVAEEICFHQIMVMPQYSPTLIKITTLGDQPLYQVGPKGTKRCFFIMIKKTASPVTR